MNDIKKWLLKTIFIISITACSAPESQTEKGSLVEAGQVTLPLDSLTALRSSFMRYVPYQGKDCLAMINTADNSIRVFDLQAQAQIHQFQFPREGDKKITEIGAFVYLSDTAWLVLGQHGSEVALSDHRGNLSRFFILKNAEYDESSFFGFGRRELTNANALFLNDSILHSGGFPLYPLMDTRYFFKSLPLGIQADLAGGTFRYLPVHFPKSYHDGNSYKQYHTRTYSPDSQRLVYNFTASDSLYEYNLDGQLLGAYLAKSKFIPPVAPRVPLTDPEKDLADLDRYYLESPEYSFVAYDAYRKRYYRFVYHGTSAQDGKGRKNTEQSAPFSVIVLSDRFEYLTERAFEPNQYDYYGFFIAPDGLYLSQANFARPDLEEDVLRFTRFQLVELGE